MEKILALVNHEGLCWKCLQSRDCSDINVIKINGLGYGGQFTDDCELHLCDHCLKESTKNNPELWNMETVQLDKYTQEYLYDEAMNSYINQLPIQGRQFVRNEFDPTANPQMEPQDWIDYELDILPREKRMEYGLSLPEETNVDGNFDFEYMEYMVYKIRLKELEKKYGEQR